MPAPRKRPCSFCRHWFRPNARVGARQHACSKPECQAARRKKTQAKWRAANPDYAIAHRIQQRNAQEQPPEPLRLPAPLNRLPWDLAKDEFGQKGADFIGVMGALLVRSAKDQFRAYVLVPTRVPNTLPPAAAKRPVPACRILNSDAEADHATGVSPTGPALGASSGAPSGPPAAPAGLAG